MFAGSYLFICLFVLKENNGLFYIGVEDVELNTKDILMLRKVYLFLNLNIDC